MADGARAISETDLARSGGYGKLSNSARAGLLPIGLEHAPIRSLNNIPVYVRVSHGISEAELAAKAVAAAQAGMADLYPGFCLYCAPGVRFEEPHRERLLSNGVRVVYIRIADHTRFRSQTEAGLASIATSRGTAIAEKSAIIYDTSVEIVNELLAEPELMAKSPRLTQLSKAITTLVVNNPSAFGHLFAASNHDFYTATHMVNVATWMVPLAYEMGIRDPAVLDRLCQAGILHDMGKVQVPQEILNKKGRLTDEEWRVLRGHPEAGVAFLSRFPDVHPTVIAVTREHHERLDGSGYPRGLKGDQIGFASRLCAVVDSFDAMTAFRPFKERTLSVEQAMAILEMESGTKYDGAIVNAWNRLIRSTPEVDPEAVLAPRGAGESAGAPRYITVAPDNRRGFPRRAFHCEAMGHVLVRGEGQGASERPGLAMVAHNISRAGVGVLSKKAVRPGEFVRIYLKAPGWEGRAFDAQAVRCRDYQDSWHEIGLRFAPVDMELLPPRDIRAA